MTVQLGPVPPLAAGLQPNDAVEAREAPRAGIDRPPFSAEATETARAVDPPSGAARAAALPDRDLPPLIPPDPQAPAGPPPAFEASILDRARQNAASPAVQRAEPAGQIPMDRAEPGDPAADGPPPYDVPPSAEQRAEVEVATVRRIETRYDTATVDVSR